MDDKGAWAPLTYLTAIKYQFQNCIVFIDLATN